MGTSLKKVSKIKSPIRHSHQVSRDELPELGIQSHHHFVDGGETLHWFVSHAQDIQKVHGNELKKQLDKVVFSSKYFNHVVKLHAITQLATKSLNCTTSMIVLLQKDILFPLATDKSIEQSKEQIRCVKYVALQTIASEHGFCFSKAQDNQNASSMVFYAALPIVDQGNVIGAFLYMHDSDLSFEFQCNTMHDILDGLCNMAMVNLQKQQKLLQSYYGFTFGSTIPSPTASANSTGRESVCSQVRIMEMLSRVAITKETLDRNQNINNEFR